MAAVGVLALPLRLVIKTKTHQPGQKTGLLELSVSAKAGPDLAAKQKYGELACVYLDILRQDGCQFSHPLLGELGSRSPPCGSNLAGSSFGRLSGIFRASFG